MTLFWFLGLGLLLGVLTGMLYRSQSWQDVRSFLVRMFVPATAPVRPIRQQPRALTRHPAQRVPYLPAPQVATRMGPRRSTD